MKIADIISCLEQFAPPAYQEDYDNSGLILGDPDTECRAVLLAIDLTEEIIEEAAKKGANLIVAHHPLIFKGIKKISAANPVGRSLISAIGKGVAVYAIHTNLDNTIHGVSGKMADLLGLTNRRVLQPLTGKIMKLYTFVPRPFEEQVKDALFAAGAGNIGRYSETSFASPGIGSFKAGEGANPFVGEKGKRHLEEEVRLELVFPAHQQDKLVRALLASHPYEEVAYDIIMLANKPGDIGSGLVGDLPRPLNETAFLDLLRREFRQKMVRHSPLTGSQVSRVALCGGAGGFLLPKALVAGAQVFVTADLKYHEFFEADGRILLADLGHFESEQFTIDLLHEILTGKFPNFAVLKPETLTNPVNYYF